MALALSLTAAQARAAPDEPPPVTVDATDPMRARGGKAFEEPEPAHHGVWPVVASVLPGVLLHGAGHYAAGDRTTAKRLLATEGVGLGLLGVSGVGLALTGASRRFVGYFGAGAVSGGALFVLSLLADIYGASGPWGGRPVTIAPSLATNVGLLYVYDPQFRYRALATYGLDGRIGSWKLGGSGTTALDDRHERMQLRGGYRVFGPGPDRAATDGSFLDLDVAATRMSYVSDRFVIWTGEISAQGRLDLARVSPSLRGSFAEFGLGWGLEGFQYRRRGVENDGAELLLARFAYGFYLGNPGGINGEVSFGYDHRHDGYAAGLLIGTLFSGVMGSFEMRGRLFKGAWGVGLEAQRGAAATVGLSLLHRHGGPW